MKRGRLCDVAHRSKTNVSAQRFSLRARSRSPKEPCEDADCNESQERELRGSRDAVRPKLRESLPQVVVLVRHLLPPAFGPGRAPPHTHTHTHTHTAAVVLRSLFFECHEGSQG